MSQSDQKVVRYLNEAHASELGLVRVLQSQIAITPRGSYRDALEKHLGETRRHAERVQGRIERLGGGANLLQAGLGAVEAIVAQSLALCKTPFDVLRGSGGEERLLKNAKDACASEALEIATYTAIERLAQRVGDEQTAKLAASIRADEQRMLERIMHEITQLTDAVVDAELDGEPSYDVTTTGAADALRAAGDSARETTHQTAARAKRGARQARKLPGVAQVEGEIKGALASEQDLAIARYDTLNAEQITAKLPELSQIELAKVDAYERKHRDRSTILNRIGALRGNEPWPGYDELTAAEITAVLSEGDNQHADAVRSYERAHKNRAGVLKAAERELTSA